MCVSCSIGLIGLIAAGFFLGSIPFGVLLAHAFGLPDPRTLGSGNIGATNMLRTGRKDVAALTLLLDGTKGAAAVWMAHTVFAATEFMAAIAVLAAVAGHVFSPWLNFKGGKGVATTIGGLLALAPVLGGMICVLWLMIFIASGISSLSAIVALALIPVIAYWLFTPHTVIALVALSAFVISRHHANIGRLLKGEESRFFKGGKR